MISNQNKDQDKIFNFNLICELGRNINNLKIFNKYSLLKLPKNISTSFLLGNLPFTHIINEIDYYFAINENRNFLDSTNIDIDKDIATDPVLIGCFILLRINHEIQYGKKLIDSFMQDVFDNSIIIVNGLFFQSNDYNTQNQNSIEFKSDIMEKEEIISCMKNIL